MEYVFNQEFIENLINFKWVPEQLQPGKHLKGLGASAFLMQDPAVLEAMRNNYRARDDPAATLTQKDFKNLIAQTGNLPQDAYATEQFLDYVKRFWINFCGPKAPAYYYVRQVQLHTRNLEEK